MTNKKVEYLKLIKNLSDDIGISEEETESLVDSALSSRDRSYVNYEDLKDEITSFVVIIIFSLILIPRFGINGAAYSLSLIHI